MKKILISLIPLLFFGRLIAQENPREYSPVQTDEQIIRKIFDLALTRGDAYKNLEHLCLEIGPRLSGSKNAEKSVVWGKKVLEGLGSDSVFLQEVMVPHWERGNTEEAIVTSGGKNLPLSICALGGSVGTSKKGITGNVIEVTSLDELDELKDRVRGKIVFYNRPMEPEHINTFHAYGGCVDQRVAGASKAAPYGAVAVVVRSMNLRIDDYPHTGSMWYKEGVEKIPAVAISTKGAEELSEALKNDPSLYMNLKLSCKTLPDAQSYNVVGEIKGTEFPDEIILVGGHLDSWDKGHGAHDDGAGCVQSIEVLNLLKKMNYKPRRTIRCVLFMNEENGVMGAKKYAEVSRNKKEFHLAAIESDRGGFSPRGFTVDGEDDIRKAAVKTILSWEELLEPYNLHYFKEGYAGVDIYKLKDHGTALFGLLPDPQRYFDHHHAESDVFEAVNKRELELGAASMTALVFLIDKYGIE